MSNNQEFTTKLSDLEFVEELSDVELGSIAGGATSFDVDGYLKKVFADLATQRAAAENSFKRANPELAKLIFSNPDPQSES